MSDFVNAVEIHLKVIAERDIQTFAEFLHPDYNCIIILPNGGMIEGHDNILNFHKQWFEDQDWRMETKTIDIFITDTTGYVLLDVVYHDLDEGGNPYEMKYFLSLLFVKIDGKWILIRDQNTLKGDG